MHQEVSWGRVASGVGDGFISRGSRPGDLGVDLPRETTFKSLNDRGGTISRYGAVEFISKGECESFGDDVFICYDAT